MNKHIRPRLAAIDGEEWRNLGEDVTVELTSEHPDYPIEGALVGDERQPWRADAPGPQTIRLSWPTPIAVRRLRLVFEEHGHARTQEFVLRAHTRDGAREIVRQQFTFSPSGTIVEREEYATNLEGVTCLELAIVPAIDGSSAVATLREWRVA
ncbi:MAG TPA: hypothetical protein VGD94_15705 [Vicinamibacterales bacterium]